MTARTARRDTGGTTSADEHAALIDRQADQRAKSRPRRREVGAACFVIRAAREAHEA